MTPWTTRLCCAAATVALLAATGCTATGGNATTEPSQAGFLPAARAYCMEKGGTVQERQPMYGTNNARESWVPLGEPVEVCQFRTTDPSASQINLDLVTLYSTHPTLAALAYLAKAPVPSDGSVNPAYLLCVSLGGGSAYGTGAAGGGLYLDNAGEGELDVVAPCAVADGSMIDDWGIAYYSNGTIRGKDLSTVFRFDVHAVPRVF